MAKRGIFNVKKLNIQALTGLLDFLRSHFGVAGGGAEKQTDIQSDGFRKLHDLADYFACDNTTDPVFQASCSDFVNLS